MMPKRIDNTPIVPNRHFNAVTKSALSNRIEAKLNIKFFAIFPINGNEKYNIRYFQNQYERTSTFVQNQLEL